MRLTYDKTGAPVKFGDKITDSDGDTCGVTGIEKPHHAGSTGRVYVTYGVTSGDERVITAAFFPSVIDATWVDREDRE